MFYCNVHTDGFDACLLFARSKKDKSSEIKLEIEDFKENEVEKYIQAITLDPRRKQVFTAVINDENDSILIRRCSSGERRCYTGSYGRNKICG